MHLWRESRQGSQVMATPCTFSLQKDIDAIQQWKSSWGMSFNASKCNIIHTSCKISTPKHTYHLKCEVLEEVYTAAVYLGISNSKDLTRHDQVHKAAMKSNWALCFITGNIHTASRSTKERAYQALVRPVVEYRVTAWDPHQKYLMNTVEMVQRRAAQYVTNNYDFNRASITSMLQELKWVTLEQKRLNARVTMAFKIVQARINYYKFHFSD